MSFSFSKIGTKLSLAKHLMSKESQLADDPKSLAAMNYELTTSGHGGCVGSLTLRSVGAIVTMIVCALLLLPAVCLAQLPDACTPNACGPVQAMPPVPQPHFDPPHDWHGDHHDGDFHGGWHGDYAPGPHYEVNPWNFVAPIIANFATAPRMIVNPLTGQPQLMSPGQWVPVNAGTPAQSYTWQPLPVWPLGDEKPKAKPEKAARFRPLRRLVIHLHLL